MELSRLLPTQGASRVTPPRQEVSATKAVAAQLRSAPSDLSVISGPTLIANGDNDRMVPSVLSTDLLRRIPTSEIVIYPYSGHSGIFQYWREFAPVAVGILTRSGGS